MGATARSFCPRYAAPCSDVTTFRDHSVIGSNFCAPGRTYAEICRPAGPPGGGAGSRRARFADPSHRAMRADAAGGGGLASPARVGRCVPCRHWRGARRGAAMNSGCRAGRADSRIPPSADPDGAPCPGSIDLLGHAPHHCAPVVVRPAGRAPEVRGRSPLRPSPARRMRPHSRPFLTFPLCGTGSPWIHGGGPRIPACSTTGAIASPSAGMRALSRIVPAVPSPRSPPRRIPCRSRSVRAVLSRGFLLGERPRTRKFVQGAPVSGGIRFLCDQTRVTAGAGGAEGAA